ncbi:hypothetical protein [Acinetobacter sp. TUM15509]|uniref:hypothetical protein n=1 Tax=Acinetobacter sp. TUM15509 TaxID=2609154 RepID=UPI00125DFE7F|nr:hypothetical protein [Acinetobacter sp. TUM15509]
MSIIRFFIFVTISILLTACDDSFNTKIYGDINNGVFVEMVDENSMKKSIVLSGLYFYEPRKSNEDLVKVIWEFKYYGVKIDKKIQKINLIEYGVVPKGFTTVHVAENLKENKKYYYNVKGGPVSADGCFYIENSRVFQVYDC